MRRWPALAAIRRTIDECHSMSTMCSWLPSRNAIHIYAILCCALFASCGGQDATADTRTASSKESGVVIPGYTPAEVERVLRIAREGTDTDIQNLMFEIQAKPLPPDYIVPEEILQAGSPSAAMDAVSKRYPEFKFQRGFSYVSGFREHPLQYVRMMNESMALRIVYKDHPDVARN